MVRQSRQLVVLLVDMCASPVKPSSLQLPHNRRGEIDWNTLGNILTAHLLGEALHLSHVDTKYGESTEQASSTATEWEFDYEKHEIMVFRKRKKDSKLTSFAGRGLVAAPYATVAEFVKDVDSTYVWDKFLVDGRYLRKISESPSHTDYLGYQMHSMTQCFATMKRDFLYFLRCRYIDGKYVQSAVSVEDAECPLRTSIPRAEIHMGTGFVVEPYRGSSTTTLVTYFGNVDVKGVPAFIMTQVVRRHPMAVHYIQRHFVSHSPKHTSSPAQDSRSPPPLSSPLTQSMVAYEEGVSIQNFISDKDSHL